MAYYQIASGTDEITGRAISIWEEAASDPGLSWTLTLQNLIERQGDDTLTRFTLHLPYEVRVPIIDFDNQLIKRIRNSAVTAYKLKVHDGAQLRYEGYLRTRFDDHEFTKATNVLELVAFDGITILDGYDAATISGPIQLGTLVETILQTAVDIPVNIYTDIQHPSASGQGGLYTQRERIIDPDAYVRSMDSPSMLDLLNAILYAEGYQVMQDEGEWHVMERMTRANEFVNVDHITAGTTESVGLGVSLPNADFRWGIKESSIDPKARLVRSAGGAPGSFEVKNANLESWVYDGGVASRPRYWTTVNPANVNRVSTGTDAGVQMINGGTKIYQRLRTPIASGDTLRFSTRYILDWGGISRSDLPVNINLGYVRAYATDGTVYGLVDDGSWSSGANGSIIIVGTTSKSGTTEDAVKTIECQPLPATFKGQVEIAMELSGDTQYLTSPAEIYSFGLESVEVADHPSWQVVDVLASGSGDIEYQEVTISSPFDWMAWADREYYDGSAWQTATDWDPITGTQSKNDVIARRLARQMQQRDHVVHGPIRFDHPIRMIHSTQITIDGVLRSYVPLMIERASHADYRCKVTLAQLSVGSVDYANDVNVYYSVDSEGGSSSGGSTGGGGVSGGGASSVAWDNVTGKPATETDWATETGFDSRYAKPADIVTDHGQLTGLGDDDHSQYYNQARLSAEIGSSIQAHDDQLDTLAGMSAMQASFVAAIDQDVSTGADTEFGIVTVDTYLDMNGNGRVQGDGSGAVEVLANDGTNTGVFRVNKLIVNDLQIGGTIDQTSVNDLAVKDQYVHVNSGVTGTPTLDAGLQAERGSLADAYWKWDEGADRWGYQLGSGAFVNALLQDDISGTANQISVAQNGDGTLSLSLPQDIATNSDVQFGTGTFSGLLTAQGGIDVNATSWSNSRAGGAVGLDVFRTNAQSTAYAAGILLATDFNKVNGAGTGSIIYGGDEGFSLRYWDGSGITEHFSSDSSGNVTVHSGLLTAQGGIQSNYDVNIAGAISTTLDASFGDDIASGTLLWDFSQNTLSLPTIEVQTLRTHIFKKDITRAMGGRFLYNTSSQVLSVDGGNHITIEDSNIFTAGDLVVISGESNSGFHNVTATVSAISGTDVTLSSFSNGSYTDIQANNEIVKVSGSSIFMNASNDAVGGYIEGYNGITTLSSSPYGASPTPTWRLGALDSFSGLTGTNGFAGKVGGSLAFAITDSEGLIGGSYFDDSAQWAGNATKTSATFVNDWSNQVLQLGTYGSPFFYADAVADQWYVGDITGTYLEYNAGSVDAVLDSILVEAGGTGYQSANFYLDSTNEQMSLGSVFSADGGANTGAFAGGYFDTTDMWGGSATKANASVRLDFANGQIYYDAMGSTIFRSDSVNGYGDISNTYPSPINDWSVTVSAPSSDSRSIGGVVLDTTFVRRFGDNEVVLYTRTYATDYGTGTFTHEVEMQIINPSGNSVVASHTLSYNTLADGEPLDLHVDVSSLAYDYTYRVKVIIRAGITTNSSQSGSCDTSIDGYTVIRSESGA